MASIILEEALSISLSAVRSGRFFKLHGNSSCISDGVSPLLPRRRLITGCKFEDVFVEYITAEISTKDANYQRTLIPFIKSSSQSSSHDTNNSSNSLEFLA